MSKDITNTERIANELLLEKYRPLMVVKLSKHTTSRIGEGLEKFALDISDKSGYEVLLFPDEDNTEVNVVSVCNSEFGDIKELKTYIYEKYENRLLGNSPYKKVKDYINKPK
mgnify:FL=1|tara:strand:+ start:242 stop:577 length:336 start_codon:yes stop_codon:yes gene_type:complete